MFQSARIGFIKSIIDLNEHFVFERRLRKWYKTNLGHSLRTIVDVGANKGQSIDFFKSINSSCQIMAFEPNKELFKKLKAKYQDESGIQIFNMGVSDSLGKKEFHQNVLDYTSSFEKVNMDSEYLQRKAKILGVSPENIVSSTYEVETTTLSFFLNSRSLDTVDVLKIDVEGHEYPCLVGLFSSPLNVKVRYIQLEQHNDDMYAEAKSFSEITKLLNANGFVLKTTVKHGFGNLDEVIFENKAV